MRANAKAQRDFAAADRIRKMLRGSGYEVRDRRDGIVELVRL